MAKSSVNKRKHFVQTKFLSKNAWHSMTSLTTRCLSRQRVYPRVFEAHRTTCGRIPARWFLVFGSSQKRISPKYMYAFAFKLHHCVVHNWTMWAKQIKVPLGTFCPTARCADAVSDQRHSAPECCTRAGGTLPGVTTRERQFAPSSRSTKTLPPFVLCSHIRTKEVFSGAKNQHLHTSQQPANVKKGGGEW